jgi:integrase
MVYRRGQRPSYYFDAMTPRGWKQLCAHTPDKALSRKIESMWDELARRHRAWDLLGAVLDKRMDAAQLYDLWVETRQDVEEIRRRLRDVDVAGLVAEWYEFHSRNVKPDSAAHALAHVKVFFPPNACRMAADVTTEWLTLELSRYPGKRNTRRKVHSSLSSFLGYLTDVRRIFAVNPMTRVPCPAVERSRIRYYELDTVERIVEAQPTSERRALFALLYGTGIEVSVALSLTRADVWPDQKAIRAAGTKAHGRDRVARVANWAWPIVWEHSRNHLTTAPLFPPSWSRYTVSDWHRQTVGDGAKNRQGGVIRPGLSLRERLPLHNARHHWAVRRLRSGSTIQDVQIQLGHSSPQLTLTLYGRFMPSAEDRDRAEDRATEYEQTRRAKGA